MKRLMKLAELRKLLTHVLEAYDKSLFDDEALSKKSVLVPDDVKDKISDWADDMGMSDTEQKNSERG